MRLAANTIDPTALDEAQTEALIDALYAVHCEVFAGVSREGFAKYVVRSPAERTRIKQFIAPDGQTAGYIAVHAYDMEMSGQPCVVVRAEAGMRRAYRGSNQAAPFMVAEVLKAVSRASGPVYYMGSLVHPTSFLGLTRYAPRFWPNPTEAAPPEIHQLMLDLGERFHLEQVDPQRPLVRNVGWITRDTPEERAYWSATHKPMARFFLDQNPGYNEGHGLITLIPLDAATVRDGVRRWSQARIGRRLAGIARQWRQLTGAPRLSMSEVADALSASQVLQGVSGPMVLKLVGLGRQVELTAGTVLFRQGDPGDALYVVLEGAMQVLVEQGTGPDQIVDQLGPGHLFGELALVTPGRRTATLRAATDTVLLRVDRTALHLLTRQHSEVADALWENIGAFRLDISLRDGNAHPALGPEERRRWWHSGQSIQLDAGDRLEITEAALLFEGNAHLELPSGRILVRAPALIEAPTHLVASGGARVRQLPPAPA